MNNLLADKRMGIEQYANSKAGHDVNKSTITFMFRPLDVLDRLLWNNTKVSDSMTVNSITCINTGLNLYAVKR